MYPPTPRVSPKGIDDIALSQIRDDRRLLSNYSDDDDLEDPFRTDRSEIIKVFVLILSFILKMSKIIAQNFQDTKASCILDHVFVLYAVFNSNCIHERLRS